MKELLLKIRHWLIKKLGGYTEQAVPPPIRTTPPVYIRPEKVVAQTALSMDMVRMEEDRNVLVKYVKERLLERMVKELCEQGYAVTTCEPAFGFSDTQTYTMTMLVLPPSEWMKTSYGDCMTHYLN